VIDRTNWENTAISYYTFGAAIGLGFDLAIREHTNGRATLDDFMRAMWRHTASRAEGWWGTSITRTRRRTSATASRKSPTPRSQTI
jgi:predicted metalloprotease with PDZ domain